MIDVCYDTKIPDVFHKMYSWEILFWHFHNFANLSIDYLLSLNFKKIFTRIYMNISNELLEQRQDARKSIKLQKFLMVGNSIKSDILPVLETGSYAAHIPYHLTWTHEQHEQKPESERFMELKNFREILDYF